MGPDFWAEGAAMFMLRDGSPCTVVGHSILSVPLLCSGAPLIPVRVPPVRACGYQP